MFQKPLFFLIALLTTTNLLFGTPLDEYVKTNDPNYSWELEKTTKTDNAQVFSLRLVSQQWRTNIEVDKPLWTHQLTIAIPNDLCSKTAILTIGEGSFENEANANGFKDISALEMAVQTHAVACDLSLIPNQNLRFLDEKDERYQTNGRKEDALVAYTWDKFLSTNDSSWLLRLPMTKAVVRGMDATQEFLKEKLQLSIDGFILVGKSKRGWTAWTTAAVDKRVKAIVPIVIDLLNLKESFIRHYMAYGNWSPAVKDYVDIEVDKKWDNPPFKELMAIIEPYSYNERFTMPKYIINAAGDEFFLPDSSKLYFSQLPGEKLLLYAPNTGHYISSDLYKESLIAYIQILLSGKPLPSYQWDLTSKGELLVTTKEKPQSVTLWQAQNPNGRDFRLFVIGKNWKSTPLLPDKDGNYTSTINAPEKGWSASFVELSYPSPEGLQLKVSTDVFVLPDQFPFDPPNSNLKHTDRPEYLTDSK